MHFHAKHSAHILVFHKMCVVVVADELGRRSKRSAHILVFHKMCEVVVEKDYKESCTCILGA